MNKVNNEYVKKIFKIDIVIIIFVKLRTQELP